MKGLNSDGKLIKTAWQFISSLVFFILLIDTTI